MSTVTALAPVTFLELEITGQCQLVCAHCYAESGPGGSHGSMTRVRLGAGHHGGSGPERGGRAVHRRGTDAVPRTGSLDQVRAAQRVAGRCLLEPRARRARAGICSSCPASPSAHPGTRLIPPRTRRSLGPWAVTGGRRRTSLRPCGGESRSGPGSWRSLIGRTSTVPYSPAGAGGNGGQYGPGAWGRPGGAKWDGEPGGVVRALRGRAGRGLRRRGCVPLRAWTLPGRREREDHSSGRHPGRPGVEGDHRVDSAG